MSDLGKGIKKLGFGFMRLPKLADGSNDLETTKKMVDEFMAAGFTYFDTAYVYDRGGSEAAIRECVVKRYPRESFQLADKIPVFELKTAEEYQPLFDTMLERTQAGYFDFVLLHALNKDSYAKVQETDGFGFAAKQKEKGLAKHIGFSFHDSAEVLDKILTEHPEAEFVQLQINYADWESESVQSRKCYEVARKHGVNVTIMEPVKGGTLAKMSPESEKIFKDAEPDMSIPSWAVRFAASHEGLITVLSGMSNMEQLHDNVETMKDFKPLDQEELATIQKVVDIFNKTERIPCTACKYCVDGCPMQINIPRLFSIMNNYKVFGNKELAQKEYKNATKDRGKASECLHCGHCEMMCPQHLPIMENLEKIAQELED